MKIARVFPTKTSMSPTDKDAYFDAPDMFTPKYLEVHISVTFSWDIPKAFWLKNEWESKGIVQEGIVKVGGVAINGESDQPFKGGLEAARVTPKIAEELRGLSIRTLWLACDHSGAVKPLRKAVETLLKAGFTRTHLYCYALIGKDITEEKSRLQEIWDIGCMPFAQLYQPEEKISYSHEWKKLQRTWSRPAATRCEAGKGLAVTV